MKTLFLSYLLSGIHICVLGIPHFCEKPYLDTIFNSEFTWDHTYNESRNYINLIRGDYRWRFNTFTDSLGSGESLYHNEYHQWTTFHITSIPEVANNCSADCKQIKKMKDLFFELSYSSNANQHKYQFYRVDEIKSTKTIIRNQKDMPWDMLPTGTKLEGPLWPPEFYMRTDRPVIYDSKRMEMVFIVNALGNKAKPLIHWNSLKTSNWSATFHSNQLNFTGITFRDLFIKDNKIYAIGDKTDFDAKDKHRVTKVFIYHAIDDIRTLEETDTDIIVFFNVKCPTEVPSLSIWTYTLSGFVIFLLLLIPIIVVIVVIVNKRSSSRKEETRHQRRRKRKGSVETLDSNISMESIETVNSKTGSVKKSNENMVSNQNANAVTPGTVEQQQPTSVGTSESVSQQQPVSSESVQQQQQPVSSESVPQQQQQQPVSSESAIQ